MDPDQLVGPHSWSSSTTRLTTFGMTASLEGLPFLDEEFDFVCVGDVRS
jgi:hypothetical protein